MKISLAADAGIQTAVTATAAVSGMAAGWAGIEQMALQVLGVPVQVVLAAATAAFLALSYRPSSGFGTTLLLGAAWTLIGSFGAQLGLVILSWALGLTLPTGALAGAALVLSGAGPFMWPVLIEEIPAALRRYLNRLGRKSDDPH